MFNNIDELHKLIKSGKSNDEIIRDQISYLENNKDQKMEPIFNDSQVYFYNGYIDSNQLISPYAGMAYTTLYRSDLVDLYDELLNTIRKNMDKNEVPLSIIIKKVRKYFDMSVDSEYKELVEYIKKVDPSNKYFVRETLPYLINYYKNSSYEGTITDFGKFYVINRYGTKETKSRYTQQIEKVVKSINWDSINDVLDLSTLKGSGIAACTEYSIAVQNCLSFLGYDSYMIAGYLSSENHKEEHNFNVVRINDTYKIVDAAQKTIIPLNGIDNPEDLLNLGSVSAENGIGNIVTYSSRNMSKHI